MFGVSLELQVDERHLLQEALNEFRGDVVEHGVTCISSHDALSRIHPVGKKCLERFPGMMASEFGSAHDEIADIRIAHNVADHLLEADVRRLHGAGQCRPAFCPGPHESF